MRSLLKYNWLYLCRLEPAKIWATEVEPQPNPRLYKLYNELHDEKFI
jgi:hypothetical protein